MRFQLAESRKQVERLTEDMKEAMDRAEGTGSRIEYLQKECGSLEEEKLAVETRLEEMQNMAENRLVELNERAVDEVQQFNALQQEHKKLLNEYKETQTKLEQSQRELAAL